MEYCDLSIRIQDDGDILASADDVGEWHGKLNINQKKIGLAMQRIENDAEDEDLLKTIGTTLYEALFDKTILASFTAMKASAGQKGCGVRLRLIFEKPEMAVLPWEFLYDDSTNTYLANDTMIALSRYIDLPLKKQDIRPACLPLKILLVVSNPKNLAHLDSDGEIGRINQALQDHINSGQIEIDKLTNATIDEIYTKLDEKSYNIFHFIGHGVFDNNKGYIALMDENNRAEFLDDQSFANIFLGKRGLGLVILNSCKGAEISSSHVFAGMAPHLVQRGIPAVIAMQYSIRDETAKDFAKEFYRSLALAKPVDEAVQSARNFISINAGLDKRDFATPVLYMRARDGIILGLAEKELAEKTKISDDGLSPKIQRQLVIRWAASEFELPEPEFVLFLPNGSLYANELILKNTGSTATKINRIELVPAVFKHLLAQGGMEMKYSVPALRFQSGDRTDLGLQLKQGTNGTWVIDTPFTVQEGQEVVLPGLNLICKEGNEIASEVKRLVGLATLEMQYDVAVFAEQETSSWTLTAPLRVLLSMDRGGDGGIDSLLEGLAGVDQAEKKARGETYRQIRQVDDEMRRQIANSLNEMLELERLEELAEEIEPYDQAIERNLSDPEAYYARGRFLQEKGAPRAALVSLDKSIALGKDSPELHLDRGNLLLELERDEEAVQTFDRVLLIRPEVPVFTLQGRALLNLGRYKEALVACDKAIELDARDREANYRRGLALINLERYDDALAAFRRTSEIDPDYAEAYFGQALSIAGRGPNDDFLAAVQKALNHGFSEWEQFDMLEPLMNKETRARLHQLVVPCRAKEKTEPAVSPKDTIAGTYKGEE
jgi:tetratricopeptide (TPR) repeat protein